MNFGAPMNLAGLTHKINTKYHSVDGECKAEISYYADDLVDTFGTEIM